MLSQSRHACSRLTAWMLKLQVHYRQRGASGRRLFTQRRHIRWKSADRAAFVCSLVDIGCRSAHWSLLEGDNDLLTAELALSGEVTI